jgi:hypothetical protein
LINGYCAGWWGREGEAIYSARETDTKAAERAAAKRVKDQTKLLDTMCVKRSAKQVGGPDVWSFRCRGGLAIPVYKGKEDFAGFDPSKPAVIEGTEFLKQMVLSDDGFKKEWVSFLADFAKSELVKTKGRGRNKIDDESLSSLLIAKVLEVVGENVLMKHEFMDSAIKDVCAPALFGVVADRPNVGFELASAGTFRVSHEGSRQVFLFRFTSVGGYVRTKAGAKAMTKPISSAAVKTWLDSATAADLEKYVEETGTSAEGSGLWGGIVRPNDLLYTPAGMYKLERSINGAHNVGLSLGVVVQKDGQAIVQLNAALAELAVFGKSNKAIEGLIKAMYSTQAIAPPVAP